MPLELTRNTVDRLAVRRDTKDDNFQEENNDTSFSNMTLTIFIQDHHFGAFLVSLLKSLPLSSFLYCEKEMKKEKNAFNLRAPRKKTERVV